MRYKYGIEVARVSRPFFEIAWHLTKINKIRISNFQTPKPPYLKSVCVIVNNRLFHFFV